VQKSSNKKGGELRPERCFVKTGQKKTGGGGEPVFKVVRRMVTVRGEEKNGRSSGERCYDWGGGGEG